MFFRAHAVCQANFCKDSDFQVKLVLIKLWIRNECSRGYRKESVRANGSRLHLGFTHCSVTGRPSPCSPAGLLCSIIQGHLDTTSSSNLDVLALSHHRHSVHSIITQRPI